MSISVMQLLSSDKIGPFVFIVLPSFPARHADMYSSWKATQYHVDQSLPHAILMHSVFTWRGEFHGDKGPGFV